MLYPKDKSVKVVHSEKTLAIEWDWKPRGVGRLMVLMGVLWEASLVLVSKMPLANGEARSLGDEIAMFVMTFGIGFGFLYVGLAFLLNKTKIHADHQRLTCKTGPIWWSPTVCMPATGLLQWFIPVRVSSGGSSVPQTGLYVMDADHIAHRVTSVMNSAFAAHQIRHELQDFYGLEDVPIYGITTTPEHPGARPKIES